MSNTNPTLTLQVSAHYKELEELKAALGSLGVKASQENKKLLSSTTEAEQAFKSLALMSAKHYADEDDRKEKSIKRSKIADAKQLDADIKAGAARLAAQESYNKKIQLNSAKSTAAYREKLGAEQDKLWTGLLAKQEASLLKRFQQGNEYAAKELAAQEAYNKRIQLNSAIMSGKLSVAAAQQSAKQSAAQIAADLKAGAARVASQEAFNRKVQLASAIANTKQQEADRRASAAQIAADLKAGAARVASQEASARKIQLASALMNTKQQEVERKASASQLSADLKAGETRLRQHEAMLNKMLIADIKYAAMTEAQQKAVQRQVILSQRNTPGQTSVAYPSRALADVAGMTALNKHMLTNADATAKAKVTMDTFNGSMREGHSLARGIAGPLGAMWLTWGSTLPLVAGAALTGTLKGAVTAGGEFEMMMARVKAVSGESGQAISGASENIKKLSSTGMFGAKDTAEGLKILTQAGFSLQDGLKTLPTMLDLATIGELGMAEAAEITSGSMHAFGLEIADMPRIASVISKAADISQTNITEIGEAMKQGSTASNQYGVSLEYTATVMAALAQVNIRGSAAGTAWKNLLTNLETPTKAGAKALQELGVKAADAHGNLRDVPTVINELKAALADYTPEDQAKLIGQITNERGSRALVNLTRAIANSEFSELNAKINESAKSTEQLRVKASMLEGTFKGQLTTAVNAFGVALIDAFDGSKAELLDLVKRFKEFAQSGELKTAIQSLVTGFVGLVNVIIEHKDAIGEAIKWWVSYKVAAATVGPLITGVINSVTGLQLAWQGLQTLRAAATVGGWGAALIASSGSALSLTALLPPIGVAIAAASLYWFLFRDRAAETLSVTRDQIDQTSKRISKLGEDFAKQRWMAANGDNSSFTRQGMLDDTFEKGKLQKELESAKKELVNARNIAKGSAKNKSLDIFTGGNNAGLLDAKSIADKANLDLATQRVNDLQANIDILDMRIKDSRGVVASRESAEYQAANPVTAEGTKPKKKYVEPDPAAVTRAESLRAKQNSAQDAATKEAYANALRLADEAQNHKVKLAKIDLDNHKINLEQYSDLTQKAFDEYISQAGEAADKANAVLLMSQKTGAEKADLINKELFNSKAKAQREFDKVQFDNAQVQMKRLNDLEASNIAAKGAGKINKLNTESKASQAKADNKFATRFDKPESQAGEAARLERTTDITSEINAVQQQIDTLLAQYENNAIGAAQDTKLQALQAYIDKLEEAKKVSGDIAAATAEANELISQTWQEGAKKAWYEYINTTATAAEQSQKFVSGSLKKMEDALTEFVTTGKLDFRSLANSMINDMIRMQIQQGMTKALGAISGAFGEGGGGLGGLFSTLFSANGNAFNSSGVMAFANGGAFTNSVVNQPTAFPLGLMGEAGPEAIMPLARGPNGKLGVHAAQPAQATQAAPNNAIRIVNVMDPSVVGDYFNTSAGEKVLVNMMRKNASAIQDISRG